MDFSLKNYFDTRKFFLYPFFFRFFRENSEIQDGCRGHMKKIQKVFFHLAISVTGIYAMQVKKV
jgi:hypothetical protein